MPITRLSTKPAKAPANPKQGGKTGMGGTITKVYSFLATMHDMSGWLKTFHLNACKTMGAGDPEFQQLFEQATQEDTPMMLGSEVIASTRDFDDAAIRWFTSHGVDPSNFEQVHMLDSRLKPAEEGPPPIEMKHYVFFETSRA
jgi:hypothetical protein